MKNADEIKYEKLKHIIASYGSLAVGFSGGVDSTFLLSVAHDVLKEKAVAVSCSSVFVPKREIDEAERFCRERDIKHHIFEFDPLSISECRFNAPERCYVCKHAIFSQIMKIAKEYGIDHVAEGSNVDDMSDYRPGMRAVSELSIKSPLREADLDKATIRHLSQKMNLPTWSKPSYACLASRFVYGEEITKEKLDMVDRAEQFLIENGFENERVRIHGNTARIEVLPEDIVKIASDGIRQSVYEELKKIGFMFVTLDLKGYATGSMNSTIDRL